MAEPLVEAQYVEQTQQIESQAEMLKFKQEIAKTKARVVAYSWKETICGLATDRTILASKLKTSDEKEKLCLLERLINEYNTKSGNNFSNACSYNVEALLMRKYSFKLMKVDIRSEIKDKRRKDNRKSQAQVFYNCNLTALQPNMGHNQEGSLTKPVLTNAFYS